MQEKYVNLEDVVGYIAVEYNLPPMRGEDFITLCKRCVQVYQLENKARKITFDMMCQYLAMYVATPWGRKAIRDLT